MIKFKILIILIMSNQAFFNSKNSSNSSQNLIKTYPSNKFKKINFLIKFHKIFQLNSSLKII